VPARPGRGTRLPNAVADGRREEDAEVYDIVKKRRVADQQHGRINPLNEAIALHEDPADVIEGLQQ
jgi:hypothetical protein